MTLPKDPLSRASSLRRMRSRGRERTARAQAKQPPPQGPQEPQRRSVSVEDVLTDEDRRRIDEAKRG